jgi:hypothetical protein
MHYFNAGFGHPVRIDYGTGHESSFFIFLYCLYKLGKFSEVDMQATTIAMVHAYLLVTRSIQTDYILEPAGSHGVWGLDDYHCLPFLLGASEFEGNNPLRLSPSSIHDDMILDEYASTYMYLGCIKYIKELKRGAPFSESSPMLNDISSMKTWSKVRTGLQKLYEGEVLKKLVVVQHFVFGEVFKATWETEGPSQRLTQVTNRADTLAPWIKEKNAALAGRPTVKPPASKNQTGAIAKGDVPHVGTTAPWDNKAPFSG